MRAGSHAWQVPGMSREEAFNWTAPLSLSLFKSDEVCTPARAAAAIRPRGGRTPLGLSWQAREGIAAFKERRDAAWVPAELRKGTGRA